MHIAMSGPGIPEKFRNSDSISVSTPIYQVKIDEVSDSVTYVGRAELGKATSEDCWQIWKISVAGTVTSISMADGDTKFDNVYDNRASLSYS